MRYVACLAVLVTLVAHAEEPSWRSNVDGTAYVYADNTTPRMDSVLNPGNQIARLPMRTRTAEARLDLKAGSDNLRVTLRPILQDQEIFNGFGKLTKHDYYLSQGEMRWHAAETVNVAAGREVLTWGPAQFRSPSNPFYFDSMRDNPQFELSGLDVVDLSWTPDTHNTVSLVHIVGSSSHYLTNTYPFGSANDPWRDMWLLKAEQRGADGAGGIALAKKPRQGLFAGAYLQYTPIEMLMLYGEAGSSTHVNSLQSPSDINLPFSVQEESDRHSNELIGATYTFDNSQSFTGEFLHQGQGFTAAEESTYFSRAANAALPNGASTLVMALTAAPPLLGRDYWHLIWQNSLLESDGYWRLMLTHSLNDGGSVLSGYGEYPLSGRVSGFAVAAMPKGGAKQEFSSIYVRTATIGIKAAF